MIMRTLAFFVLAFLPALSLAEEPQDKAALCSYLGDRIVGLSDIIDDAIEDIPDEMYRVFKESKICETVGWTTLSCKGDDNCVEEKTEQMVRESLIKARKVEKWKKDVNWPGGHEIFHCCKIHAYMKLRLKFTAMKSLLACESDSVVAGETSRKRRNVPSSYQPHHYQPGPAYGVNTIWFQYHLCQDQEIYCWFFTDQWRQGDFGDYYLYDNLLEDVDFEENSLLPLALLGGKGSDALLPLALLSGDDNDDLLPLALLSGGFGGGHGYGYGGVPGVRYRRDAAGEEDDDESARKRREDDDNDDDYDYYDEDD